MNAAVARDPWFRLYVVLVVFDVIERLVTAQSIVIVNVLLFKATPEYSAHETVIVML